MKERRNGPARLHPDQFGLPRTAARLPATQQSGRAALAAPRRAVRRAEPEPHERGDPGEECDGTTVPAGCGPGSWCRSDCTASCAVCGNGVVEAGEECDCGWEDDCHEKCCFPMRSVQVLGERPCTLRPSSKCSPSQVTWQIPHF